MAEWISNKRISSLLIWLAYKILLPINELWSFSVTVISIMCLIIFKVKMKDFSSAPPPPANGKMRQSAFQTWIGGWRVSQRPFRIFPDANWSNQKNLVRNITPVVIYSFAFHFQVKFHWANLISSMKWQSKQVKMICAFTVKTAEEKVGLVSDVIRKTGWLHCAQLCCCDFQVGIITH